jgi:hypothetical protein
MTWEATPTQVELMATIFDLTRRVERLERTSQVDPPAACDLVLLLRCYRDAHAVLQRFDRHSAAAWVALAYLWDVRMLLDVGRAVADPFPFRPLLAVLDTCVLEGIPGALAARSHLEAVAQDLLRAMGLELVRPRDTMARLHLQELNALLQMA